MKNIELKIKSKHLTLEPSIIRLEENRLKRIARRLREHQKSDMSVMSKMLSLQSHRRGVKLEARATYLARAYLSGKKYNEVEVKRKEYKEYDFRWTVLKRIMSMVNKYKTKGSIDVKLEDIADWTNVS
ncbi:MAG: hypothetical protein COA84_13775 [Robiginitomaculum sp.]|nr:MAG: hypothetical protein COA84_13775 [Robiginitomaculum sp.]